MHLNPRPSITAWPTREQKVRFAALAASRGLSESRLLGLIIDSVLARNPTDSGAKQTHGYSRKRDRITVRLRPGDGELLRVRAQARGMSFSTYAATLVRANVRAHPPMPIEEVARLELGLAQLRVMGVSFRESARAIEQTPSLYPALRADLLAVLSALERLRQELRDVIKLNRISWESADVETAP